MDPSAGHEPDRVDLSRPCGCGPRFTRGACSGTAALAMVFKLIESAQARWWAVNAPRLVALAGAGARLARGRLIERPEVVAA